MSQPEAKSRAELIPEPSVPDTLRGNQYFHLGQPFGTPDTGYWRKDRFGAGEGLRVNLKSGPYVKPS